MNLIGSIRQIDDTTVIFDLDLGDLKLGSVRVSSNVPLWPNPTALIPAFLPIAARLGYDLDIEGVLDSVTVANATQVVDTLVGWDGTLERARLVNCNTSVSLPATRGVACLASLGLDSFYSLHTRREEVTHFVLCRGFDISIDNRTLWEKTVGICRIVAASEGKELIEVTTDIRHLADPHLSWTKQFHGAALASFAHLLDQHFSHLIIPSSFTSDEGIAWGSHSQLDPLWSSSCLKFEHHELGVDRVAKMRAVGDNENAMRYMRVCVEDLEVYNCGKCEKCIRTMCNAVAAGVADRLLTLPAVTPERIKEMPLRRPTCIPYHEENLRYLQKLPAKQRRLDLETAIGARLLEYAVASRS